MAYTARGMSSREMSFYYDFRPVAEIRLFLAAECSRYGECPRAHPSRGVRPLLRRAFPRRRDRIRPSVLRWTAAFCIAALRTLASTALLRLSH